MVALGNDKVLSMPGAKTLDQQILALGFEVYDPDMSMRTLGGGCVHCLCQSLCREKRVTIRKTLMNFKTGCRVPTSNSNLERSSCG